MGLFWSNSPDPPASSSAASSSSGASGSSSSSSPPSSSATSGLPLPPEGPRFTPRVPKTTLSTRAKEDPQARDNSKPDDWLPLMASKQQSKYTDPCAHATRASMKCLEDNAYDRSKCMKQFRDYRDCKKIWVEKRRNDRFAQREGAFD